MAARYGNERKRKPQAVRDALDVPAVTTAERQAGVVVRDRPTAKPRARKNRLIV